MSFKVTLSERLPDFPLPVKFVLPNGVEATFAFTVKALTSSELNATLKNAEKQTGAQFVKSLASGWELEDEFNDENINELVDRYPAVVGGLISNYTQALAGYRVKN